MCFRWSRGVVVGGSWTFHAEKTDGCMHKRHECLRHVMIGDTVKSLPAAGVMCQCARAST